MARILVIDDSDFVREFLSDCLSDAGHEVVLAEDGKSGLAHYHQQKPDCILLDVIMPDIDGIEVLREVRAQDQSTPILLMTGDDPGWARRTCEEHGASGFLSKAFYADKVVERVEELLLDLE